MHLYFKTVNLLSLAVFSMESNGISLQLIYFIDESSFVVVIQIVFAVTNILVSQSIDIVYQAISVFNTNDNNQATLLQHLLDQFVMKLMLWK